MCPLRNVRSLSKGSENGKKNFHAKLVFLFAVTEEERKQRAEANHPVFLVQLKDTELLQDTYLRFMVKVKGNPNPTVRL